MRRTKNQGIYPMDLCAPWFDYSINNQKHYQKIYNKTNMTCFWKALDNSLNNFEGLNQWEFLPLGPTFTYTISNLNNLSKFSEANICIYGNRFNNKYQHPHHELTQSCRGSKYSCPFWISPTDNLQYHPSTNFSINEHWSNKNDTHKSTINKMTLEQRNWWIFYINKNKNLKTNNWWMKNPRNNNNLYWFTYSSINQ